MTDSHSAPGDSPGVSQDAAEAEPQLPLLRLREALPEVTQTPAALAGVVDDLAASGGPVAVDAERASGYRYTARAYLVQLRHPAVGTALLDPVALDDLAPLAAALGDREWVLHAATQDLPCLAEVGLVPSHLFDTELAARLLGYPKVGLASLTEQVLGYRLRKEHSAVDWSTRPLPPEWLEYAALDVEQLCELRDALAGQLRRAGRADWAEQEFAHLLVAPPHGSRRDEWRRTSGIHRVHGRRGLAAIRELWTARDNIARHRDVAPGRVLPDSALVAAARARPRGRGALLAVDGFHGRGAARFAKQWVAALDRAGDLPDGDLPPASVPPQGPPPVKSWSEQDPQAAARLARARPAVAHLAEELGVPTEILLTPDTLRRLVWDPPRDEDIQQAVAQRLDQLGARAWQVRLTAPVLAQALEATAASGTA